MACHCGGNSTSALLKLNQLDLSCVIRNTHKQTPTEQCPRITLKIHVQKIYVREINLNFFSHEIRPGTKPEVKFPGEHVHTSYVHDTSPGELIIRHVQSNVVHEICPKTQFPGNTTKINKPG